MFQRGQRPASSSSTAPEEAFTLDVEDLYAENSVSASVAVTLLAKATQAGVAAFTCFQIHQKELSEECCEDLEEQKVEGQSMARLVWVLNPSVV